MTRNEQYDLALEIVQLQDKIKERKKNNRHARLKCNLKKIGALSKIGIAFSAVPLAGTLITCAAGWNPFKLNDYEATAVVTTTIDKEGNLKEEKEYNSILDDDGQYTHLEFYTAWNKTDNGNYKREVYSYALYDLTKEEIERIYILNQNHKLSLEQAEEFITEKIDEKKNRNCEYCSEIPKEDIDRAGRITLSIRDRDNEDTKIIKESKTRHVALEIYKIGIEAVLTVLEIAVLYGTTFFFKKRKRELQESPYYIDTKELEQQLKAKQLLFETIPYQALLQLEQATEPQKVLKKEPERMQQGQ